MTVTRIKVLCTNTKQLLLSFIRPVSIHLMRRIIITVMIRSVMRTTIRIKASVIRTTIIWRVVLCTKATVIVVVIRLRRIVVRVFIHTFIRGGPLLSPVE